MYHIKNDKRSMISCALLYEGLKTCMETKNIDEIKIKDLVETAGVARVTFYRNFDNIVDILILKSDETFELLMNALRTYHQEKQVNRGSEFIIPFLEFFDKHTEVVELLLKAKRVDILHDSMNKTLEKMYGNYAKVASDPHNTWRYFVAIRTGITIGILIEWVKSGKAIPPDTLGKNIFGEMSNSYSVGAFM